MKQFDVKINLDLISSQISGNLQKINNNNFDNVSELNSANSHSVCFYENSKYFDQLINSKAGLIFVKQDFDKPKDLNTNLIFVEHPYIYFMMLVKKWIELDSKETKPIISQSAVIHPTAKLGTNVNISPNSVIEKNVIIGDNTTIGANSVIMHGAKIGAECKIFPNVTIYHECEIKNRVILHSGVVIGADGFGFLLHEGIQQKIPQVGNVVIESDVEIGANSCVDRSTLGTTIIGKHTKIDNLVQIGHNCEVGQNNILCAQSGLAGNTTIKNRTYIAGQVGVAGHLTIGNDVMVGAQSGVTKSIKDNQKVFGTPAIDAMIQKRVLVSLPKLPRVLKDIRKLKNVFNNKG